MQGVRSDFRDMIACALRDLSERHTPRLALNGAMLLAWYKKALQTTGVKPAEISRRTGITADVLSKVLKNRRKLSFEEAVQIADALGIDPPSAKAAGSPQVVTIQVVGEVAAGVWHEPAYDDFVPYSFPYSYDGRWPPEALEALVIRGESVNRRAKDGAKVVTLKLDAAPRGPRDGDWVIAMRRRGDLIETTVKQMRRRADGVFELWPDSDDARFQEPLQIGEHDGEVTMVTAFVLDFVSPATEF